MSLDEDKNPYRPFQSHPVEPHYGRDRGFLVRHTKLDLKIDERAGTVAGSATLTLEALIPVGRIELDAEDLQIADVRLNGTPATFDVEPKKLVLELRKPLKEGASATVHVRYSARPRRGLYFIQPDRHYPRKPYQIWSQGESEDNRCWFPAYDYPNNKASSETLITVRTGLTALSNGQLVEKKLLGRGWVQYHWKQEVPQPNYLIAVVVGRFDEVRATWDRVPLHYFVPQGQKEWGRETFRHTPEILEFLSRATGFRYPYPKYAQAIVADFMWGGMENTSMTTVNDRFLIGPQHRDDADPDGLIAHEAAHQWFGNLVTTKSWEHIWLNEGFATYFDALFHEDFHGADEFQYELWDNAESYFAEDREQYRRPIVTRVFDENEDVFDRHTYQKGSLVLHMLRHELGDDLWWKSVRHYLKKHQWKNVETTDLKVAIEEASGRNLDWFFDQWIHKAGHPELEATTAYDPKSKQVKLTIKQVQKVVGDTPLFRVDLPIWVWTGSGVHAAQTIRVSRAEESYFLPVRTKPKCVQLDPDGVLLKRLKFERDASEWVFQLKHSPSAFGRIEATLALAKKPNDRSATPALRDALLHDKFWGVRRQAALALGEQETPEALAALLAGPTDKHPRVRRGVANALGHFPGETKAVRALQRMRAKDRSDYARAAALFSLAKVKAPRAFEALKSHLAKRSHNEVVASSCLLAFAELKDPRAVPILLQHTQYGRHQLLRSAATQGLAKLWDFVDKRAQEQIRDAFQKLLKDRLHQERRAAYRALADIGDETLRGRLSQAAQVEPIGLIRKMARESLRTNTEKAGQQAQLGDLKKQLEDVQLESRKLKATVAEIEKKLAKR